LPLLHVKENGDSDDIIVVSQKDDIDILVSVPVSDNCKHDNITVNNPKDHVIIFTVKRKVRRTIYLWLEYCQHCFEIMCMFHNNTCNHVKCIYYDCKT